MSETAQMLIVYAVLQMVLIALLFWLGRRLSDRFWKATDLVWFAGALFGAVGALERWQEQQATATIEGKVRDVQRKVANANFLADRGHVKSVKSAVFALVDHPAPEARTLLLERLGASEWYKIMCHKLSEWSPNRLLSNDQADTNGLLSFIPDSPDKSLLRLSLQEVYVAEADLEATRASLERPWWARELSHWFPFVMAAMIALRVTRVCAEVFILGRGSLDIPTDSGQRLAVGLVVRPLVLGRGHEPQ